MLDLAAKHESELQFLFSEIVFDEQYKYFSTDSYRDRYKASESTWNRHEFVSIDSKGVVGYFSYSIDRDTYSAGSLQVINFRKDSNLVFAKDLRTFLKDIFEKFKFNKLKYSVVIGNPIEKSYDRFTEKYGGRIIGVSKKEAKLFDGELYDMKLYEILREEYLESLTK